MPPNLSDFVKPDELAQTIDRARREDLGPAMQDVTSMAMVPQSAVATAHFRVRQDGVICGLALLWEIVQAYDAQVKLKLSQHDGARVSAGDVVAQVDGSLRSILALERIALNFMTLLSGVATLTARFVDAAEGTRAKICDTRKTLPTLRGLQKYAVVCGGGVSHRTGLYDAMLVKDNHLAHLPLENWQAHLTDAIATARRLNPELKFVEVEVDSLTQLQQVLACGVDMVLLDNMTLAELSQAAALRDQHAPKVLLEASGGVTLHTVGEIARTGVDRISSGALTHSAPALDIALDMA